MKFTQYTHRGEGRAPGKHYWLEGTTLKKATNGIRTVFNAKQVEMNLDALPKFIRETSQGVYLTSGLSEHAEATAITIPRLKEALEEGRTHCTAGLPLIAFADSDTPHRALVSMMLIDSDGEQPAPVHQQLVAAVRALADYARVEASSSSSNIFEIAINGGKVRRTGLKGLHTFYAVQDGTDIPRTLGLLHKRLVLAGFLQGKLSKAGSYLERSAVDRQLAVPSQPIYIRPVLGIGLEQEKSVQFFDGAEVLDTRAVLPDLTEAEEARYAGIVADDRHRLKPEIQKARTKYIGERAEKIVAQSDGSVSLDQAKTSVAQSLLTGVLDATHIVMLSDGSLVTVGEILANQSAYHGLTCRDPEEHDYGSSTVAKIYLDGPQPVIHSFAHGGRKYYLRADPFATVTPEEFADILASLDKREAAEVEAMRGNPVIAGWLDAEMVGIRKKVWTEQGNRPAAEVLLEVLKAKVGIGVEDQDDEEGEDQVAGGAAGVDAQLDADDAQDEPGPVWSIVPDPALDIPGVRFRKAVEEKAKLLKLDLETAEKLLAQWAGHDKTEAARGWGDFFGEHLDNEGVEDAMLDLFSKTAARLLSTTPAKAKKALVEGIRTHDARIADLYRRAKPRISGPKEERKSPEAEAAERLRAEAAEAAAELEQCRSIAENPLAAFDANMAAAGLAGERQSAFFSYLIMTSAHLAKPANGLLRGPAGSGKSYVMKAAGALFPAEMVYAISSMSAKALVYEPGGFQNRTIILDEAESLVRNKAEDKNDVAEMLRVLLSEQRLVHKVVVKNPDTNTFETQTVVVEGPTNLLTSTTRSLLDPEIESRMVDRWSDTSEPHMRAVLEMIGERAAGGKEPDRQIEVWHTFARWVRRGPTDVMIPFAKLLAASWSVGAGSRTFRDLNNLISITRASALVHRLKRKVSEQGLIIAEVADYRIAYDLLGDRIDELSGARVPPGLKSKFDTLSAAYIGANAFGHWYVSVRELATVLGTSKSSMHRDLNRLESHGLVEVRRDPVTYRAAKLGITPVSPAEAAPIFKKGACIPTPEELLAAIAEVETEGLGSGSSKARGEEGREPDIAD